jgi:hypothetical protein
MSTFWEKLRDLDAYPKPLEDFRIKTFGGGAVTILSSVIMCLLFVSELSDYLTPQKTEELFVDTSRSNKLRINVDIEFPNVACSYLTIDAMDSSGEQQSSIEHSIFKQRLDHEGLPMKEEAPVKTTVFGDSTIGKKPDGLAKKETDEAKKKDAAAVMSNDTGELIRVTLLLCRMEIDLSI